MFLMDVCVCVFQNLKLSRCTEPLLLVVIDWELLVRSSCSAYVRVCVTVAQTDI